MRRRPFTTRSTSLVLLAGLPVVLLTLWMVAPGDTHEPAQGRPAQGRQAHGRQAQSRSIARNDTRDLGEPDLSKERPPEPPGEPSETERDRASEPVLTREQLLLELEDLHLRALAVQDRVERMASCFEEEWGSQRRAISSIRDLSTRVEEAFVNADPAVLEAASEPLSGLLETLHESMDIIEDGIDRWPHQEGCEGK